MSARAEPTGSQDGSREAFDRDWQKALTSNDSRWLSYPCEEPSNQTELFEWVKARRVEQLLAAHEIRSGRVLEYGCGSAGMSIFLANRGFRTWAVDVSSHALQVARLNASRHGSPDHLRLLRGDSVQLPFADGVFDVVMSYGLLEHFSEGVLPELVGGVLRALRPGGLFLADIVPGPERFSVRTIGLVLSIAGSALYHLPKEGIKAFRGRQDAYSGRLYENALDDREWAAILAHSGLRSVGVEVCRPFPPLALSGGLERAYVRLMQAAMPLWERFDGRNTWLSRRWGWMYLAYGVKA